MTGSLPRGRWHPTRSWRGYASLVAILVMPLARFLTGKTHSWFFRVAGTVLAATFTVAITTRYHGDARWVAYLSAFGAVTLVYWLFYAPAKYAYKDNCWNESKEAKGGASPPRTDYAYEDITDRMIIHNGQHPSKHYIPVEIGVLQDFVDLGGRYQRKDKDSYTHFRQWRPPGFWHGHEEYMILRRRVSGLDIETSHLLESAISYDLWDHSMQHLGYLKSQHPAAFVVLMMALMLDNDAPKWREQARQWKRRQARRA